MKPVIVYSSDYCLYCMRAKYLLESKGVASRKSRSMASRSCAPK